MGVELVNGREVYECVDMVTMRIAPMAHNEKQQNGSLPL